LGGGVGQIDGESRYAFFVKRAVLGLLAIVATVAVVVVGGFVREQLEDGDALSITEADLVAVRQLPVMWSPVESGAPAVYDFSKKQLTVSTMAYRRAMRVAEVLIQLGDLAPGQYEYDSPLDPGDLVAQPFVQHRRAEVLGNRVTIQVTEAHLKLMRAAGTNLVDEGGRDIGVEIDPKRPYGDMTYFEIDMAEILGIVAEGPPRADRPELRNFTEPQLQKFAELHEQMEPVLQVFLKHAELTPGHFVRNPPGYGRWHRR
jgi:hypothetical protein